MSHGVYPHFRTGSQLLVVDEVALSLRRVFPMRVKHFRKRRQKPPLKLFPRRYWRKGRAAVLARYAGATGLRFTVVEQRGAREGHFDLENLDRGVPGDGVIRLARTSYGGGYATVRPYTFHPGHANRALVVTGPYTGFLCHEFGHALGLAHREGGGAKDTYGPGGGCLDYIGTEAWELPDAHDIQALRELYAHTD